jgi:uncharacterized protein (DUF2249 family)
MTTHTHDLPERVAAAGVTRTRPLDVRRVIESGGDPFRLIMATIGETAPDEAVELIVGFEPTPLYTVLAAMAYASETERRGEAFHVFIFRDPAGGRAPGAEGARPALQPPVEIDVRGLEPPQPLLAIFEKLAELGPGAQLLVHHDREPRLLYDKLAARGYAARTQMVAPSEFRVQIAPAWAFAAAQG